MKSTAHTSVLARALVLSLALLPMVAQAKGGSGIPAIANVYTSVYDEQTGHFTVVQVLVVLAGCSSRRARWVQGADPRRGGLIELTVHPGLVKVAPKEAAGWRPGRLVMHRP